MSYPKSDSNWSERVKTRQRKQIAFALLNVLIFIFFWRLLGIRLDFVSTFSRELRDITSRMFPPDLAYATELGAPLVETVQIAIAGTVLSILFSIPVAYIAAENTSPNAATYYAGRLIVSSARALNALILAILLVIIFGPGALAGMLAIGFSSVGFIGKLLAEEIEEIDPNQVKAIRATGASVPAILLYGVVPQIKPAFAGISIYRWDINVRGATVLGIVGAGGIGVNLQEQIQLLNWDAVATILIIILLVVLVSEGTSAYVRHKIQ